MPNDTYKTKCIHLRTTNHKIMNVTKLKVKEDKMQKAEVSINFQRLDDFQLVSYFSKAEHVESAFRELIRRFQLPLYNHVRTMLVSHSAADDVIQNIFVKIWDGFNSFRTENLKADLYRISSNETIGYLRKKFPQIDFDEAQPEFADFLNADEFLSSNSDELKFQKAMCYLTYKQKLVFTLNYFDGLSFDEIAELTQTTESSIVTTFQHAVKKLEIYIKVLG
jgi:RNA polymerase sigma-70 factor (ECF subfamily)